MTTRNATTARDAPTTPAVSALHEHQHSLFFFFLDLKPSRAPFFPCALFWCPEIAHEQAIFQSGDEPPRRDRYFPCCATQYAHN
jgi:hypothetical protein